MSDEEWNRWAGAWNRGGKPLPNVMKRAKSDRRRAFLGLGVLYAIAMLEVGFAIPALRAAKSFSDAAAPALVTVAMAVIIAGAHVVMRGTWSDAGRAPGDLLDAMERRHAARRRLGRLTGWCAAFLCAGAIGVAILDMIHEGRFDVAEAGGTLGICAFAGAFVWVVLKRTMALIERELREAAEARRLLADGLEDGG